MSLEVVSSKDEEFTASSAVHPEITETSTPSICVLPHKVENQHNDGGIESENVFGNISIAPSMVHSHNVEGNKLVQQNLVAIDSNSIVNFTPDNNIVNNIQVVAANNNCNGGNGTIYLLVSSNDSSTTVLQPIEQPQQDVSTSSSQTLNIITNSTDHHNLKHPTHHDLSSPGAVVQVMNTEGVPVNLNINELFASIQNTNKNNVYKKDSILNLSTSIISTTGNNSHSNVHSKNDASQGQYIINPQPTTDGQINSIPNWAMHLRDCVLCGDTYTGYVTTEIEMDAVLNLYKKETQSLFAIRQTPSPAKDESADTVRLMWKSQYVPYDGIPFVNVGRRATVMECEHGPRKRSNALKRMAQMHGQKHNLKKVPNLTCPARLFVKKVRKFPQYRVPIESDPKIVRSMQNHALKMVRSNGIHSGEIRLYMQLPLPTAHRYHHIGNSVEAFQKELDNLDQVLLQSISVDSRVMTQLQLYVRQGYANPFQVRAALKEFVENKIELDLNESKPAKHDKAFFPTLIEIQNMIQQTEAAVDSGILHKLPTPDVPPVPIRPKRKRTISIEPPMTSSTSSSSSLNIKRTKIEIPAEGEDIIENELKNSTKPNENDLSTDNSDQNETIALSLTDSQLENFSVTNFTYDQLAQLAKIGLIALNNAAKDGDDVAEDDSTVTTSQIKTDSDEKPSIVEPVSFSTSDGESILIVTPNNNAEEEKARLRILTGNVTNDPEQTITNVAIEAT